MFEDIKRPFTFEQEFSVVSVGVFSKKKYCSTNTLAIVFNRKLFFSEFLTWNFLRSNYIVLLKTIAIQNVQQILKKKIIWLLNVKQSDIFGTVKHA